MMGTVARASDHVMCDQPSKDIVCETAEEAFNFVFIPRNGIACPPEHFVRGTIITMIGTSCSQKRPRRRLLLHCARQAQLDFGIEPRMCMRIASSTIGMTNQSYATDTVEHSREDFLRRRRRARSRL